MDFFEEVYKLTRQIPKGKISTYGAIAKALGDIRASRAVGLALNLNPDPEFTPCYKIVHSDGRLGGFGRGIEDKIRRLKKDGIAIKGGRIVDFGKHYFDDFQATYPLKELRREQLELSKKVMIKDGFGEIGSIAGIDVAYTKANNKLIACAAYVIMDYNSMEIIEKGWIYDRVKIPYIPTYLAYTELPLVEKLWNKMKEKPTIIMLDGHGIMHPYRLGLASHVGVVLDVPTIGVAKSPLYGNFKEEGNYFLENGREIGYKLTSSAKKPVYISPGHLISLETAIEVARHFSIYRIPEPTRQAHILAGSKIREL